MSNNKMDGHLGHLAIAEQLEETNQRLTRIATALERTANAQERTANALERANEIEIGLHPLSVEEFNAVQKENDNDN